MCNGGGAQGPHPAAGGEQLQELPRAEHHRALQVRRGAPEASPPPRGCAPPPPAAATALLPLSSWLQPLLSLCGSAQPPSCPHVHHRRKFTTIIGPNGSGKSNVMDAVSFVLGVRTAQLRGSLKELLYHNTAGQSAEDRWAVCGGRQRGSGASRPCLAPAWRPLALPMPPRATSAQPLPPAGRARGRSSWCLRRLMARRYISSASSSPQGRAPSLSPQRCGW